MEREDFTIGQFARILGVSRRTVDFYTRQGLLHPEQTGRGHGYRRYTEEDRRRVHLIKQMQAQKFTLQEIRRILDTDGKTRLRASQGAMEKMAADLERLQELVAETRALASDLKNPAIREVAGKALHRASGLCSLLVTMLNDMPPV